MFIYCYYYNYIIYYFYLNKDVCKATSNKKDNFLTFCSTLELSIRQYKTCTTGIEMKDIYKKVCSMRKVRFYSCIL